MVVFPQVRKGFSIPHPATRFLPGHVTPIPDPDFSCQVTFLLLFIYFFLLLLFSVAGMQLEVLKG